MNVDNSLTFGFHQNYFHAVSVQEGRLDIGITENLILQRLNHVSMHFYIQPLQ